MKKLYFTSDFSEKNVKELQAQGYILRNSAAYHAGDTLEDCDQVAGEAPQAYKDKYEYVDDKNKTTKAKK